MIYRRAGAAVDRASILAGIERVRWDIDDSIGDRCLGLVFIVNCEH